MVVLAQLVRASDCGSEGRGFEPHTPPFYKTKPLISNAYQGFLFIKKSYPIRIAFLFHDFTFHYSLYWVLTT